MNKIIVMYYNEDKIINMSLYDFIKIQYQYVNDFFSMQHNKEEYQIMKKQIETGYLSERFPHNHMEHLEYNKFRYLIASNISSDIISIADYNNFNKLDNYTIEKDKLIFNHKGIQFPKDPINCWYHWQDLKIYTTETYDDVINYYSSHQKTLEKITAKTKILTK